MVKITKDQFLTKLVREYFIDGNGVTIWEGEANKKMGPHKREVYKLNGDKIANYVWDPEILCCNFRREMAIEKPVFEELLRNLNGKSDPSDYVVLLSLLTSQYLDDSRKVNVIDRFLSMFSPRKLYENSNKLKYAIGKPDDYKPKVIKVYNKRLSF